MVLAQAQATCQKAAHRVCPAVAEHPKLAEGLALGEVDLEGRDAPRSWRSQPNRLQPFSPVTSFHDPDTQNTKPIRFGYFFLKKSLIFFMPFVLTFLSSRTPRLSEAFFFFSSSSFRFFSARASSSSSSRSCLRE